MLAQSISVDHFALRWHDALVKSRRVLELAGRVDELHWQAQRELSRRIRPDPHRTDRGGKRPGAGTSGGGRASSRPGLLADALYVKALLAQLRGQWEEARAQSDRGGAGGRPSAASPCRAVLEYETGNDVAGGRHVQRLIDADRDAQPYPLAGIFTAVALSQIAYITNGMTDTEPAIRAARAVMASRPRFVMPSSARGWGTRCWPCSTRMSMSAKRTSRRWRRSSL